MQIYFFFSSRRRHTRCLSDWSSDVCSSDLMSKKFIHEPESLKAENIGLSWRKAAWMAMCRISPDEAWRVSACAVASAPVKRSEERRVGKEGRSRWSPVH